MTSAENFYRDYPWFAELQREIHKVYGNTSLPSERDMVTRIDTELMLLETIADPRAAFAEWASRNAFTNLDQAKIYLYGLLMTAEPPAPAAEPPAPAAGTTEPGAVDLLRVRDHLYNTIDRMPREGQVATAAASLVATGLTNAAHAHNVLAALATATGTVDPDGLLDALRDLRRQALHQQQVQAAPPPQPHADAQTRTEVTTPRTVPANTTTAIPDTWLEAAAAAVLTPKGPVDVLSSGVLDAVLAEITALGGGAVTTTDIADALKSWAHRNLNLDNPTTAGAIHELYRRSRPLPQSQPLAPTRKRTREDDDHPSEFQGQHAIENVFDSIDQPATATATRTATKTHPILTPQQVSDREHQITKITSAWRLINAISQGSTPLPRTAAEAAKRYQFEESTVMQIMSKLGKPLGLPRGNPIERIAVVYEMATSGQLKIPQDFRSLLPGRKSMNRPSATQWALGHPDVQVDITELGNTLKPFELQLVRILHNETDVSRLPKDPEDAARYFRMDAITTSQTMHELAKRIGHDINTLDFADQITAMWMVLHPHG
ncbi:hypothetical protein [Amycolatopsis sp. cmx-4-61]|uniref:hypothetical protein n=1 Tax=Amycolatopsis sp. cmx-4-61 TaxID=2790937 RepID=UPI00397DDA8C